MKIKITGIGDVPSFKNGKQIAGLRRAGRNLWRGNPRLITHPTKQAWMDRCTRAIESQLRSAWATGGTGTATGCVPLSWIVSSLPLDDSLKWIASLSVNWRSTSKDAAGFEMGIERMALATD